MTAVGRYFWMAAFQKGLKNERLEPSNRAKFCSLAPPNLMGHFGWMMFAHELNKDNLANQSISWTHFGNYIYDSLFAAAKTGRKSSSKNQFFSSVCVCVFIKPAPKRCGMHSVRWLVGKPEKETGKETFLPCAEGAAMSSREREESARTPAETSAIRRHWSQTHKKRSKSSEANKHTQTELRDVSSLFVAAHGQREGCLLSGNVSVVIAHSKGAEVSLAHEKKTKKQHNRGVLLNVEIVQTARVWLNLFLPPPESVTWLK